VLVVWLGIRLSKFYGWRKRDGKVNEDNAQIKRVSRRGRRRPGVDAG
jgi:hypothetical protein